MLFCRPAREQTEAWKVSGHIRVCMADPKIHPIQPWCPYPHEPELPTAPPCLSLSLSLVSLVPLSLGLGISIQAPWTRVLRALLARKGLIGMPSASSGLVEASCHGNRRFEDQGGQRSRIS